MKVKFIVFLSVFSLFSFKALSVDCSQYYTQWSLPEETIEYIAETAINHFKLEKKNHEVSRECTDSHQYVYGSRPEDGRTFHPSVTNLNKTKIKEFLRTCKFDNNVKTEGVGSVSDSCPDFDKVYEQSFGESGSETKTLCRLVPGSSRNRLYIRIGSLFYSFPFDGSSSFEAGEGRQDRNLQEAVSASTSDAYISINRDTVSEAHTHSSQCPNLSSYSLNFCASGDERLVVGDKSLVCYKDSGSRRFCIYGRGTGPSVRRVVAAGEECPLRSDAERNVAPADRVLEPVNSSSSGSFE